jgi:hypothetical protein
MKLICREYFSSPPRQHQHLKQYQSNICIQAVRNISCWVTVSFSISEGKIGDFYSPGVKWSFLISHHAFSKIEKKLAGPLA